MKYWLSFIFCCLSISICYAENSHLSYIFEDEDIYILFKDIYDTDRNDCSYVAIILDPKLNNIKIEPLINITAEKNLIDDANIDSLADDIWGKLMKYLYGKTTVYFSVSGYLSNIPLEYLPCPERKNLNMNDCFGIYRISDLSKLVKPKDNTALRQSSDLNITAAVLVGGLEYNLSDHDNIIDYDDKRNIKGKPQFLPFSLKEVQRLDTIFRNNNAKVSLFTGQSFNKTNFNNIAQLNPELIHLATHGFYNKNHLPKGVNNLKDWMYERTGICLSGNYKHSSDTCFILLASDINKLNLNKCKLVTLSSCQSNFGDDFEGIRYNIPKSFSESNNPVILSTLWSIEDKATQLFMQFFYDSHIGGSNPYVSIKLAQRKLKDYKDDKGVKTHYPYRKFKYWAPYILTDYIPREPTAVDELIYNEIELFNSDNRLDALYKYDAECWKKYRMQIENDALIFIYNYTTGYGQEEYIALAFSKEYPDGIIKHLGNISDSDISAFGIFNTDIALKYTDKFLNQINDLIVKKKKVYFRPSGFYSKIPIESISEELGYDNKFYRISSGEALSQLKNQGKFEDQLKDIKHISLIGGIIGSKYYAPFSDIEVENIAKNIPKSIQYDIIQGENVTKDEIINTFNRSNIIVLSTHCGKAPFNKYNNYYFSSNIKSFREYILSRHFIVLPPEENNHPEHYRRINPYININNKNTLTGLDFSQMNLDNIDLFVATGSKSLYAFSTSCFDLGILTGLKDAGVKSILGTIFSNEAKSASIIMPKFFEYYFSTGSKQEALRMAKHFLRTFTDISDGSSTYYDPKYWMPYVLIDAFD